MQQKQYVIYVGIEILRLCPAASQILLRQRLVARIVTAPRPQSATPARGERRRLPGRHPAERPFDERRKRYAFGARVLLGDRQHIGVHCNGEFLLHPNCAAKIIRIGYAQIRIRQWSATAKGRPLGARASSPRRGQDVLVPRLEGWKPSFPGVNQRNLIAAMIRLAQPRLPKSRIR